MGNNESDEIQQLMQWLDQNTILKQKLDNFCNKYSANRALKNACAALNHLFKYIYGNNTSKLIVPSNIDEQHNDYTRWLEIVKENRAYIDKEFPDLISRIEKFVANRDPRLSDDLKNEMKELAEAMRPLCPTPKKLYFPKVPSVLKSPSGNEQNSNIVKTTRTVSFSNEVLTTPIRIEPANVVTDATEFAFDSRPDSHPDTRPYSGSTKPVIFSLQTSIVRGGSDVIEESDESKFKAKIEEECCRLCPIM